MTFTSLQELFADESRWCKADWAKWILSITTSLSSKSGYTLKHAPGVIHFAGLQEWNDHPSTTIADIRRVCAEAVV